MEAMIQPNVCRSMGVWKVWWIWLPRSERDGDNLDKAIPRLHESTGVLGSGRRDCVPGWVFAIPSPLFGTHFAMSLVYDAHRVGSMSVGGHQAGRHNFSLYLGACSQSSLAQTLVRSPHWTLRSAKVPYSVPGILTSGCFLHAAQSWVRDLGWQDNDLSLRPDEGMGHGRRR